MKRNLNTSTPNSLCDRPEPLITVIIPTFAAEVVTKSDLKCTKPTFRISVCVYDDASMINTKSVTELQKLIQESILLSEQNIGAVANFLWTKRGEYPLFFVSQ